MKNLNFIIFTIALCISSFANGSPYYHNTYQHTEPKINNNLVQIDFENKEVKTLMSYENYLEKWHSFKINFKRNILSQAYWRYYENQLQKKQESQKKNFHENTIKILKDTETALNKISNVEKCTISDQDLLKEKSEVETFESSLYLKEIQQFLNYKKEESIVNKAYCNLRLKYLKEKEEFKENAKKIIKMLELIEKQNFNEYKIENKTLHLDNKNNIKAFKLISGFIHGNYHTIRDEENNINYFLRNANFGDRVTLYFYQDSNKNLIELNAISNNEKAITFKHIEKDPVHSYYQVKDLLKLKKKERIDYCKSLHTYLTENGVIDNKTKFYVLNNINQCNNSIKVNEM